MKIGVPAILLLLALIGTTLFYARFIEPGNLEIHYQPISDPILARTWGKIRIAQLSDLHIGTPGKRERKALNFLAKIAPDLIVITGDLTQWGRRPEAALNFIKRLQAPLGVYAVLGDADLAAGRYRCRFCHPGNNYRKLRHCPRILRNEVLETAAVSRGNRRLCIIGLGPAGETDIAGEFRKLGRKPAQGTPVLVLSHFSRAWARVCTRTDRPLLWLSGDTHGGQIRLPGWFWKFCKIKPDPDHMAGLFHYPGHHQWLYVNRGLGTTAWFPFRLGVRPEITVFSFTPGKPERTPGGRP